MKRRYLVALALLAVVGTVVGIKLSQQSPKKVHRFGVSIYMVPNSFRSGTAPSYSDCVASNQCVGCGTSGWTNANPGLQSAINALPSGTQIDFATDGCYEVNRGLQTVDTGFLSYANTTYSFNGNPAGVRGENAELYDSDSSTDGEGPSGAWLRPVLQLTGGTGATVEHLILVGANTRGVYNAGLTNNAADFNVLGTRNLTVDDVFARSDFGDCLYFGWNTAAAGGFIVNLNTVVENMSVTSCGRQGISPLSNNGLLMCGISIGGAALGNAFDFENDTTGVGQEAENVHVTGQRCTNDGVVAQGCYFNQPVIFAGNLSQQGNIVFDNCIGVTEPVGAGAIQANPDGSSGNTVQEGPITFSDDQIQCGTSGALSCLQVYGPYVVGVRGSTIDVGDASTTQSVYNVANNLVPSPPVAIPVGRNVEFFYRLQNTGADPIKDISINGSFCGLATYLSGAGPVNGADGDNADITLTLTGGPLTAGSYTLNWNGETTPSIPYTDTGDQVVAILRALDPTNLGSVADIDTDHSGHPANRGPINSEPITLRGIPASNPVGITPSGFAPTAATLTDNIAEITHNNTWVYECDKVVNSSVVDTGTASYVDATSGTPGSTADSYTVNVRGFGVKAPKKRAGVPLRANLNEGTKVPYGGQLYLGSDCVNGYMTGLPRGNVGTFGLFSATNTPFTAAHWVGFFQNTRGACPYATETFGFPTLAAPTVGTPVGDVVTVYGTSGPANPSGNVSFYICGPTSGPQPCTSKTTPVSTNALTAVTSGPDDSSVVTSNGYPPGATGWYCFGAYYPGAKLAPGGYLKPSSDTSQPTTMIQPPNGRNLPYDGCFDVS